MNDKQRCKFMTRLSDPDSMVSPGEAVFIESLGEVEEFTDAQRQRIDRLHQRYGRSPISNLKSKNPKPAPLEQNAAIEAQLNPCRHCGGNAALRGDSTCSAMNRWQVFCGCLKGAGLTGESAESVKNLWNLWNPSRPSPLRATSP